MKKNTISNFSKIALLLSAVMMAACIFFPIWRIELDAPQYPEGLRLQIFAGKLGGDVDIINGLNHYIGMKTLHANNFIEFTVLPYIIGFFTLLFLVAGTIGKKRWLYISLVAFVIFGIAAMVDFWMWEYNYGHNLDPNAAIIVPGMAYQPPLIGFKQLLNFGAFSIPDIGGWLMLVAGILLVVAVAIEANWIGFFRKRKNVGLLLFLPFAIVSCSQQESSPISLHKDNCSFCKMTIADGKFGAEVITQKGRVYKFDDLHCLKAYTKQNSAMGFSKFFVHDYNQSNFLISAETAFFVTHESIRGPMGGNTAAFKNKEEATVFAAAHQTIIKNWSDIYK